MANGNFLLSSGRQVRLVRLHVDGTYDGVLSGDAAAATPFVLARVEDEVATLMRPGRPLVIRGTKRRELSPYRLIAQLECRRGVRTADPDFGSRLYVCCFIDDLAGATVNGLIESALAGVDWEAQAEDFDATLF